MTTLALARGWRAYIQQCMQSHGVGLEKGLSCGGDALAVRHMLSTSAPACPGPCHVDASNIEKLPQRVSPVAAAALSSSLNFCHSPHTEHSYYSYFAGAAHTPAGGHCRLPVVRTRRTAAVVSQRAKGICSNATRALARYFTHGPRYGATAAAERGCSGRPARKGTTQIHSWRRSTLANQLCGASLQALRGLMISSCIRVQEYSLDTAAQSWRICCDEGHGEDLGEQRRHPPVAISCGIPLRMTNGSRATSSLPVFHENRLCYDSRAPSVTRKCPCCNALLRRLVRINPGGICGRRGRNDMPDDRGPVIRFPKWRNTPGGEGPIHAVYFDSGVYWKASRQRHTRRLVTLPWRHSHAAVRLQAAEGPQRKIHRPRIQRQHCLESVDVRQTAGGAAATYSPCRFVQACAALEGAPPTTSAYTLAPTLPSDLLTCPRRGNEVKRDINACVLLRHEEFLRERCGEDSGTAKEKTLWGSRAAPLPMGFSAQALFSGFSGLVPRFSCAARGGESATWKRPKVPLDTPRKRQRVGGAACAYVAATAAGDTPHLRAEETGSEATSGAPVRASARAEIARRCSSVATRKGVAGTGGATAAASRELSRASEALAWIGGLAGTTAARLAHITLVGRQASSGGAADAHGIKGVRGGSCTALANLASRWTLKGLAWQPPAAATIVQESGRWKKHDLRPEREACGSARSSRLLCGWVLAAAYSSCSAAAVAEEPGKGGRRGRRPLNLSKKELKGLQGHPLRYKLMGGKPEFHHIDRNKNGHICEPTDKFQVVLTTSKINVHAQVLNKSRAYRTIFGSFAGNVGYRKREQQEPQCAYRIGQNIARKCRRLGISHVDVKFRRIMRVDQVLQAFAAHGLGVTSITHEPRLSKSGPNCPKPRKRRRV